MSNFHHHNHDDNEVLATTSRVEAYSDAIIAIIMALLIFDLKVPHPNNPTITELIQELKKIVPNFLAFILSFGTLAVIWINHHHFFHPIHGTNRALLWINNGLLLWVCMIPFAAGLLGSYPHNQLAVALYGVVMFCVAFMFMILVRYVFFHSVLVGDSVPYHRRRREFLRSCLGPALYALGVVCSWFVPYISIGLYILVPIYYVFPNSLE